MFCCTTGLSLRSNPGLKLANAFGVFSANFKLRHYREYGNGVFFKIGAIPSSASRLLKIPKQFSLLDAHLELVTGADRKFSSRFDDDDRIHMTVAVIFSDGVGWIV